MALMRWSTALVLVFVFGQAMESVAANLLSRDEIDSAWEEMLRMERYESVFYGNPKYSAPTSQMKTDDQSIEVVEARKGYLWGFFGLSDGGGWRVEGRLESEVRTGSRLLQLYSKATSKWFPGFAFFWMPGYDLGKYPIWEFRLVLRNPDNRQDIKVLKSISVPTPEVLRRSQMRAHPDDPSCPRGQRCPRGEVEYDAVKGVAVVRILGISHPISVEVPID